MKLNVNQELTIRTISQEDLRPLWEVSYGPEADLEWMNWNGPYFNDSVESWEEFRDGWGHSVLDNPHYGLIIYQGAIIGIATAHFADGRLGHWLEFGIVIYPSRYWQSGIGTLVCRAWLKHLFNLHPELPHIGFTTWSGNQRMMKLGEKLGMTKEAQIRKVRFWQNQYFDSVKYGILREEFQ